MCEYLLEEAKDSTIEFFRISKGSDRLRRRIFEEYIHYELEAYDEGFYESDREPELAVILNFMEMSEENQQRALNVAENRLQFRYIVAWYNYFYAYKVSLQQ